MDFPNKSTVQGTPPSPEPKHITPVITGAVQVPRPATKRFLDYAFAESPKVIMANIWKTTLVPRGKAAIEEAIGSFVGGMLWSGKERPMSNVVQAAMMRGGGVNYQQISGVPSVTTLAAQANTSRAPASYQDIVCPSQESAELLLAKLLELINQYRMASIADLLECANLSPTVPDPANERSGWMSVSGARITKQRDGFHLELPRPTLL